jgi:hypothetical protein
MALADAHAGHDPFIVGVDHVFQVGIAEHTWRNVCAQGGNFGANRFGQ